MCDLGGEKWTGSIICKLLVKKTFCKKMSYKMGVGQIYLFINQLLLFIIKLDWWSKHKHNEVCGKTYLFRTYIQQISNISVLLRIHWTKPVLYMFLLIYKLYIYTAQVLWKYQHKLYIKHIFKIEAFVHCISLIIVIYITLKLFINNTVIKSLFLPV